MARHSNATTHDDSVPNGDLQGAHLCELVVDDVLFLKKGALDARRVPFLAFVSFVQAHNVTTSAEGFSTGARDESNSGRGGGGVPIFKLAHKQSYHVAVKRVEGLVLIKLELKD